MFAALSALLYAIIAQPDPGTILVANSDPVLVTFALPAGTEYQLDYPLGSMFAAFDQTGGNVANTFTTYVAKSRGDFNGDNLLNGKDVRGFASAVISGIFNPLADFNDDGLTNLDDLPGFTEAVIAPFPASGVVLYVRAYTHSSDLGDSPIVLLTDPDHDSNFTPAQTQPVTMVEFSLPNAGLFGSAAEFYIQPAIAPLSFSSAASATWVGAVEVDNGTGPACRVVYSGSQIHVRTADNAAVLIGDGLPTGTLTSDHILHATGYTRGRMTFDFGGRLVQTPEFGYYHVPSQFRFVAIELDPHDPEGYEPTYGQPYGNIRTLHILNPADPGLDTYWWYQAALEVPIEENADSLAIAPLSLSVDLIAYDAVGGVVDSFTAVSLTKFDNDGDPSIISYRSDLVRPFIVIDAAVNKAAFPDLRILQVDPDGYVVVRKH